MLGCKPIFNEDYDRHYPIDVYNKTVLDLGASHGDTAYYFLSKGATKVIAVEGADELFTSLLCNINNDKRIIPILSYIRFSSQISDIIAKFLPDIVKVDIEGAEENIIGVPIRNVSEWVIECHTGKLREDILNYFLTNKFKLMKEVYNCEDNTVLYFKRN